MATDTCQCPATKRDGRDPRGRQRYAGRAGGRDFTEVFASAFAGYRWPADVILLAVRWSLSHPLSATSVMELLAERGLDVSKPRTDHNRPKTSAKPPCGPSAIWRTCSTMSLIWSSPWPCRRHRRLVARPTRARSPAMCVFAA
jgi:hypothetical protein